MVVCVCVCVCVCVSFYASHTLQMDALSSQVSRLIKMQISFTFYLCVFAVCCLQDKDEDGGIVIIIIYLFIYFYPYFPHCCCNSARYDGFSSVIISIRSARLVEILIVVIVVAKTVTLLKNELSLFLFLFSLFYAISFGDEHKRISI